MNKLFLVLVFVGGLLFSSCDRSSELVPQDRTIKEDYFLGVEYHNGSNFENGHFDPPDGNFIPEWVDTTYSVGNKLMVLYCNDNIEAVNIRFDPSKLKIEKYNQVITKLDNGEIEVKFVTQKPGLVKVEFVFRTIGLINFSFKKKFLEREPSTWQTIQYLVD